MMNIAGRKPVVPLGEVLNFRNDIVHPRDMPHGRVTFVGLEHVEPHTGMRIGAEEIELSEMTGRRARFQEGDIVYGYLRPYLNKVWVAEFDGLCSVDQYVFSVRNGIDRNYVAHFLRSIEFLRTAPVDTAPGQLPRIRSGEISKTPIPLPQLPEQRRIAAILDKADALRRKRNRVIELLDNLTQSIFQEMFGDTQGLPTRPLGKALSRPLRNGLSPAKSGSIKARVLTLSAITGKVFRAEAAKEADFAIEPPSSQRIMEGEFLICRGNGNKALVGIGVMAPFSMPATAFPDTIIAGRVDDHCFDSRYFEHVWNSPIVRRQIEQSARTTNGTFKINQQVLERIEIPLPDRRQQTEFGQRVLSISSQRVRYQGQLQRQQHLFSSLQHRAFSGQL